MKEHHTKLTAAGLAEAIEESISGLQRRVLAALADGAQVLQIYPDGEFSAWCEDPTGKPAQACAGLSHVDMTAMRFLIPCIERGQAADGRYEFFYLPASARGLVRDALTLSMPAPSELSFRLEYERRQVRRDEFQPGSTGLMELECAPIVDRMRA